VAKFSHYGAFCDGGPQSLGGQEREGRSMGEEGAKREGRVTSLVLAEERPGFGVLVKRITISSNSLFLFQLRQLQLITKRGQHCYITSSPQFTDANNTIQGGPTLSTRYTRRRHDTTMLCCWSWKCTQRHKDDLYSPNKW